MISFLLHRITSDHLFKGVEIIPQGSVAEHKNKVRFKKNSLKEVIMDNDKIKHFVAEKIEETRAAIFYCHSNSPLKIHNTIIHTTRVDENGNICFFINRPSQLISQFEQEFPVALNYFKKGNNYSLNIFGKARIVNDPEELAYRSDLTTEEVDAALTTQILVMVRIFKVDFLDRDFEKKNLIFKKIWSFFCRLFDSAGAASASYDFTPVAAGHNYSF